MSRFIASVATLLLVASCGNGTNPVTGGGGGVGGGGGSNTCTGNVTCSGEINSFNYNSGTDRITINNLPFDLNGTYDRNVAYDTGAFRGYVNTSGSETYVALFSANLATNVAAGVVGTDGYLDFGYGGTVYTSSGGTVPNVGEATFDGDYAGLRITADDTTPLDTTTGNVQIRMDFNDFDVVGAVDVVIYNRVGATAGALPDISGSTTQLNGLKIKQTTATEAGGTATGTLEGIIGGNVGAGTAQVAGVVVISDGAVQEKGAFVAGQTSYIP